MWTVVCEGDYWTRDEGVSFRHSDTAVYLGATGQTFGRPINGQVGHIIKN